MANPLDYLMNLIPENTNMFGASPNANLKRMSDLGLLGSDNYTDMLAKAKKQSIFQGLLNTTLTYAAQPKNQGTGSIFPYLAKAGLSGMKAAQTPYDNLTTDAIMNQKLQEMKRADDLRKAETKFREGVLPPQGSSVVNPNKQVNIPSTTPISSNSVAPNFGLESVSAPMAQELGVSEAQLPKTTTTISPEEMNLYKRYTSGLSSYEDYMSARQNLLDSRKPTYNAYKSDEDVYKELPDGTQELVRKGVKKVDNTGLYPTKAVELANGDFAFLPTPKGMRQGYSAIGVDGQPYTKNLTPRSKGLTEAQSKAFMFGNRMETSNAAFESLFDENGQPTYSPSFIASKRNAEKIWVVGEMLGAGANLVASDEDQMASQSMRDFINAVLRNESGAAIAEHEFTNAQAQYFPEVNDGAKARQLKSENRAVAIATMKAAAGQDPQAMAKAEELKTQLTTKRTEKKDSTTKPKPKAKRATINNRVIVEDLDKGQWVYEDTGEPFAN